MNDMVDESIVRISINKPPRKKPGTREILPYKDVEKAYEIIQRMSRATAAKRLYCSPDKLKLSLEHYENTDDQDQYEHLQPYDKLNLVIT